MKPIRILLVDDNYVDRLGDSNLGFAKWIATALANFDYGALGFNANLRERSGWA